ncbi:hypothetical protein PI125_g22384 [Phytophthora idaei]|nr:hypothetical protein PI125_g22384 [Phytophthora idaei]
MDGNPSMRGPSESATHIAHADCPPPVRSRVGSSPKTVNSHWGGGRSDDATDVVTDRATRCCSGLHSQGAARCCCHYGYDGVVRDDTARAVIETAREQLCGKEGEPLLRWLVEVDTAIAARRIFDDPSKVAFAMSYLGGRARSWAYGRRLTDATCFGTYAEFKEELRQAFEPPKNEFRSRAEFLDLQ